MRRSTLRFVKYFSLISFLVVTLFVFDGCAALRHLRDAAKKKAKELVEEFVETAERKVEELIDEFVDTTEKKAKELVDETVNGISDEIDTQSEITKMEVVEQRGNSIVINVWYEKGYKCDNIVMKAYVLSGGYPLNGFESQAATINKMNGSVGMIITWVDAVYGATQKSDHIKIVLSRDGDVLESKTFPFRKEWTASTGWY